MFIAIRDTKEYSNSYKDKYFIGVAYSFRSYVYFLHGRAWPCACWHRAGEGDDSSTSWSAGSSKWTVWCTTVKLEHRRLQNPPQQCHFSSPPTPTILNCLIVPLLLEQFCFKSQYIIKQIKIFMCGKYEETIAH